VRWLAGAGHASRETVLVWRLCSGCGVRHFDTNALKFGTISLKQRARLVRPVSAVLRGNVDAWPHMR